MHRAFAVIVLSLIPTCSHPQESSKKPEPAPQQHTISAENAQALRQDLQRMKALVQQMQTNLAFVTNTQGPLKHQFELEIEMWQIEIASMERRLGKSGGDETRK